MKLFICNLCRNHILKVSSYGTIWTPNDNVNVEDYDVDVRNIRNGVVDIRNNVVVKCCK